MEDKVLELINVIRLNKELKPLDVIFVTDTLRNDIGFNSFDLAELTVRVEEEFGIDIFEDGLVLTIGEIFNKLS